MKLDFVMEPRRAALAEPAELTEPHRSLHGAEDAGDRRRQSIPVRPLLVEVFTTETCERVEPRLATGVGRGPLGTKPTAFFETMQGGIQRALLNLEHGAGHLLQAPHDGVPMNRAERDDLQNQHIERPLQQVGARATVWLVRCHTKTVYTCICSTARHREQSGQKLPSQLVSALIGADALGTGSIKRS